MKKHDLLLEVGTEELPARFLPGAMESLKVLAKNALDEACLSFDDISSYATPRRLVMAVKGIPEAQPDRQEKIMGPPAKVAFGPDGKPTKAAEGFARNNSISVEELTLEETERGPYVVIQKIIKGKDTSVLLREILPGIITSIPFEKSMRWGKYQLRFARPIRWIAAVYGDKTLKFKLHAAYLPSAFSLQPLIESGNLSLGHRFMSTEPLLLGSNLDEYLNIMESRGHVIVDPAKRREMVLSEAETAAQEKGGNILSDPELLEINTFLTEFPSAVCGSFDPRFLSLPEEVLITSMKEHQKYFSVVDRDGRLMPFFVAINNTRSPRPELVRKGHERVLAARLSDASFFYEEDKKQPLESLVPKLQGMVFYKGIGTLYDKTMRVAEISRHLARHINPSLLKVAERAAYLSKADLLTQMVGEFPCLQGIMGREYAVLSGEPVEVAEAIWEHYLPVRSGGEIPESLAGAIVSIADKADTICAAFALGLQPTGGADPYGLRRAALGILHILEQKGIPISLTSVIEEGLLQLQDQVSNSISGLSSAILEFFLVRFRNDLVSKGFQADIVEAAVRADFGDVVDCIRRIKALSAVRTTPEFEPLSIAFKRVMNILKGFEGASIDANLLREKEERALYNSYMELDEKVSPLFDENDYEKALITLLAIKPYVDSFFDHVMVMVEDEALRENRLALLWHISRLFLKVGDLSAIVVEVG